MLSTIYLGFNHYDNSTLNNENNHIKNDEDDLIEPEHRATEQEQWSSYFQMPDPDNFGHPVPMLIPPPLIPVPVSVCPGLLNFQSISGNSGWLVVLVIAWTPYHVWCGPVQPF